LKLGTYERSATRLRPAYRPHVDAHLLEWIRDDERRACQQYNADLSQQRLDAVLAACRFRRAIIEQFRHAQRDCERATLARVLDAMAADLYADR
jgi:hypothetical protein